jgi:hypothetical protein
VIPAANSILNGDLEFVEQSSRTFRLDVGDKRVSGFADGTEAMKQAIYLILATERFKWVIFSWNYGVEFDDLFGMPVSWVIPEAKRRISEALLQDSRITAVDGFEFEVGKGKLTLDFTAHTVFGDVPIQKEVEF